MAPVPNSFLLLLVRHLFLVVFLLLLVRHLLLVAWHLFLLASLLVLVRHLFLVAFLLLLVRPGAPSSVLAPSSVALVTTLGIDHSGWPIFVTWMA